MGTRKSTLVICCHWYRWYYCYSIHSNFDILSFRCHRKLFPLYGRCCYATNACKICWYLSNNLTKNILQIIGQFFATIIKTLNPKMKKLSAMKALFEKVATSKQRILKQIDGKGIEYLLIDEKLSAKQLKLMLFANYFRKTKTLKSSAVMEVSSSYCLLIMSCASIHRILYSAT